MWIARFKIWHKTCEIRPLCKKHKVTDFVYVVKSWTNKGRFYYLQYHILSGREEDKKRFSRDFRKIRGIKKLEYKGNCLFTLREEPLGKSFDPIFNPKIIQLKPVVQRTDGFEDWELASWDKKELMKIFKIPIYQVRLHSVEKRKATDIVLAYPSPDLTTKQKEAIQLAMKHGYYEFPRKIDLVHLALLARVSRPSFQERLRKAEKKILPVFTESIQ
jgi:predicted DNA binding protein